MSQLGSWKQSLRQRFVCNWFIETLKGSEGSRSGQGKEPDRGVFQQRSGLSVTWPDREHSSQLGARVKHLPQGLSCTPTCHWLAEGHLQQPPRPPNHLQSAKGNPSPKGAANIPGGWGVHCPVRGSGTAPKASVPLTPCLKWLSLQPALILLLRLCRQTSWVQTSAASLTVCLCTSVFSPFGT